MPLVWVCVGKANIRSISVPDDAIIDDIARIIFPHFGTCFSVSLAGLEQQPDAQVPLDTTVAKPLVFSTQPPPPPPPKPLGAKPLGGM